MLAHARALLTSSPEGRTGYIHADLRDPIALILAATHGLHGHTVPKRPEALS